LRRSSASLGNFWHRVTQLMLYFFGTDRLSLITERCLADMAQGTEDITLDILPAPANQGGERLTSQEADDTQDADANIYPSKSRLVLVVLALALVTFTNGMVCRFSLVRSC
jgi:hypothetical protein